MASMQAIMKAVQGFSPKPPQTALGEGPGAPQKSLPMMFFRGDGKI